MKQIPLTQGKFALVDDDMFDYLSQWKWHCTAKGYAVREFSTDVPGVGKSVFMHRLVAKATDGLQVDHVNGIKLDNRRENLRGCTHAQNARNRKRPANNTSGYKGVYWSKACNKWMAYTTANRRQIYLGVFDKAEEAARAYDAKARELFGEFASTNF